MLLLVRFNFNSPPEYQSAAIIGRSCETRKVTSVIVYTKAIPNS